MKDLGGDIALYIGIACILIAAALRARTALKERQARRQVTDTARCAGCGGDVRLNEAHVAITRHVEYVDSAGSITVLDAEPIGTYHMVCGGPGGRS